MRSSVAFCSPQDQRDFYRLLGLAAGRIFVYQLLSDLDITKQKHLCLSDDDRKMIDGIYSSAELFRWDERLSQAFASFIPRIESELARTIQNSEDSQADAIHQDELEGRPLQLLLGRTFVNVGLATEQLVLRCLIMIARSFAADVLAHPSVASEIPDEVSEKGIKVAIDCVADKAAEILQEEVTKRKVTKLIRKLVAHRDVKMAVCLTDEQLVVARCGAYLSTGSAVGLFLKCNDEPSFTVNDLCGAISRGKWKTLQSTNWIDSLLGGYLDKALVAPAASFTNDNSRQIEVEKIKNVVDDLVALHVFTPANDCAKHTDGCENASDEMSACNKGGASAKDKDAAYHDGQRYSYTLFEDLFGWMHNEAVR